MKVVTPLMMVVVVVVVVVIVMMMTGPCDHLGSSVYDPTHP